MCMGKLSEIHYHKDWILPVKIHRAVVYVTAPLHCIQYILYVFYVLLATRLYT